MKFVLLWSAVKWRNCSVAACRSVYVRPD